MSRKKIKPKSKKRRMQQQLSDLKKIKKIAQQQLKTLSPSDKNYEESED